LPLQRVLTDFGADVPFGQAPDKLTEHYGIAMPASTIRRITEYHAHGIDAQDAAREVVTGVPDNRTSLARSTVLWCQ
jgi:hypothetical protein